MAEIKNPWYSTPSHQANTIGAKSNDATIARHVVEMKTLIDRIKEQVQNVE